MVYNSLGMILVQFIFSDIQRKNQDINYKWSLSCKGW